MALPAQIHTIAPTPASRPPPMITVFRQRKFIPEFYQAKQPSRTIRQSHLGSWALTVTYILDMSTSTSDDWRAAALRELEEADARSVEAPGTADIAPVLGKLALLVVLSLALVFFLGFGAMFAVGLVGWYLFSGTASGSGAD